MFLSSSTLATISQWGNNSVYYDVDFQPNTSTILYAGPGTGTGKTLLVMSGTTGSNYSPTAYSGNILAVSCSRDFSYIAIGTTNSFAITNTSTKKIDLSFSYSANVWGVRASDDSNYVVVGTATGKIDIYSRMCGTCPNGEYLSGP
jgi:hypothetical protein